MKIYEIFMWCLKRTKENELAVFPGGWRSLAKDTRAE